MEHGKLETTRDTQSYPSPKVALSVHHSCLDSENLLGMNLLWGLNISQL